ncbi:DUF6457 domain-containing protein [Tessaracoccus antarcticus]|uniref:Molybdopterin-guanine dinucleotide biosynthesis protein A n=1 Tax=Tessaracoccus antarcticus TaxID=2479848 RepID=A0A3M0GLR1_9ACTN|nr:DUF6457 domain-containing protein [Tessaracoccus antarcticus]RMB62109.1 molybdopterin-guanine dinucleotide biosynthesis protein A [Tessaracoccus antarcticus]
MQRKPVDEQAWQPWVSAVAASVGIDPLAVSIPAIHEVTSAVSHSRTRPMGPVAAHIWGLARGMHPQVDPDVLRRAIIDAAEQQ